jgi:hypothetical protein
VVTIHDTNLWPFGRDNLQLHPNCDGLKDNHVSNCMPQEYGSVGQHFANAIEGKQINDFVKDMD